MPPYRQIRGFLQRSAAERSQVRRERREGDAVECGEEASISLSRFEAQESG
jgi:hypothetical protein